MIAHVLWQAGAALAGLLAITYIFYQRHLSQLSKFPGPFLASFSDWWKFWQQYNNRMPWALAELHDKYGPVVRVGPDELSFATIEANSTIYKSDWPKGKFYDTFTTLTDGESVVGTKDYKAALQIRRVFSSGVAVPYIQKMEPLIDQRFALLRIQLDKFASTGESFDLRMYLRYLIADILGRLAFGQAFGAQETEDAEKLPPATEVFAYALRVGQVPWLTRLVGYLLQLQPADPAQRGMSPTHRRLNKMAMDCVTARTTQKETNEDEPPDILATMLATRHSKTGQAYTTHQLFSIGMELIFAGSDTTSNAINILLSNLGRNPAALRKVEEEIHSQLPPLQPAQAAYSFVGLDQKLSALEDAVRESYRQNTISMFNMTREVPVQGAVISGFEVPGGTQVFVNNYVLHRSKAIWGPDAHIFDPERWNDERGTGKKDVVSPFVLGRRTCAGQKLAIALVGKAMATLLAAYVFDFLNTEEPIVVRPVAAGELETPLIVKCRRRGDVFVQSSSA